MIELTGLGGEKFDVNPTVIFTTHTVRDRTCIRMMNTDYYEVQESREVIRKMVKLWYRDCFGATVNNVMERKM